MGKTLGSVYVLAFAAAAVGAPALKPAPAKEKPGLAGEWVVEELTFNGKDLTARVGEIRHTFGPDGDWRYAQSLAPEARPRERRYEADPAADPPTIDLMMGPQQRPGQWVQYGIYRLDGDVLTLCYPAQPRASRPTRFESADGSGVYLIKLRRAKP